MKIQILYGSEGGNAQGIALQAHKTLHEEGFETDIKELNQFTYDDLKQLKHLIIITSTTGEGDPPSNADELYDSLELKENKDLEKLNYAVFGIGQQYFEYFCKAGKDFDKFLENCGAKRLLPIDVCGDDYSERIHTWMGKLLKSLESAKEE